MPTLLRDGECDAACNTESCDWDEGDCFHHHGLAAGPGSLCPWFSSVPAPAERLTAPAGECYRRDDGADYRGTVHGSLNGLLENEHGASEVITTTTPATFTVNATLSHQDECAYLHMDPAPNSTLSCMGNAGVRDIVSRIPLSAKYPDQNHRYSTSSTSRW